MSTKPIKVLVVDDSLSIRMLLREIINKSGDMIVVGTAMHPLEAREKLRDLNPDVMTLDVEMPHMDGLTFLDKVMKLKPLPVVMISTLTHKGSHSALQALSMGAVEVIGKPVSGKAEDLAALSEDIVSKVRAAGYARVGNRAAPREAPSADAINKLSHEKSHTVDSILKKAEKPPSTGRPPIIAIGSSTGGTEAVKDVLLGLSSTTPPVLIVQHITPEFIASFAERLNQQTPLTVQVARDGMPLEYGNAYVAPGTAHLGIKLGPNKYFCKLFEGVRVNRHLPAVDVLFRSVADQAGAAACGVILTGMGEDGAKGLKEIFDNNGFTIGQNQESCVVYGMPKAAFQLGGVKKQLPLSKIAQTIVQAMS